MAVAPAGGAFIKHL